MRKRKKGGDEEAVDGERKILSCSHARREGERALPFSLSLLHPSPSF